MAALAGKKCASCSNILELTGFGINRANKDGYEYNCKTCVAADKKRRRLLNLEKYKLTERAYSAKRRKLHPGKVSAWKKESKIRTTYRRFKKNQCESCGFLALDPCQLDVDHIDENRHNNSPSNLQTLCANCHRLKSKLSNVAFGRYKLAVVK